MGYKRKLLTEPELDEMRIALSVRREKVSPEPCCEFCGHPPVWRYGAVRMQSGEFRRCWRWCACGECAHAIERNDWMHIENKMVSIIRLLFPLYTRAALHKAVHMQLQEFHLYVERVP